VSISLQGVPASIANLIQDRTLERVIHESIFPRLLFRGEAIPELWMANIGERQIFTRAGLMEPDTDPLIPGQDPLPASYGTEQWEAEARQFGKAIDTHMPTNYVTLASQFLTNAQKLGLHAAQTMDRTPRDTLFRAYLSGEAMTLASAAATATSIRVTTLNGFTQQLQNGRLESVSSSNPLPISFSGTEPANTVIGFALDDPMRPAGSGMLILGAALTVGVAQREGVFAATRARRMRVGGGATVDAMSGSNILKLNDVIAAVTRLRNNSVPTHADGHYHVHISPDGEQELFADDHWQKLHTSLPDSVAYRDLVIGAKLGCIFYRNTECPSVNSVKASLIAANAGGAGGATLAKQIGGELTNANGVTIKRAIVTGGGAQYEKYLDESKFITEAGVQGKIGQFSIVNNGVAIMAQRIRYILRAPQDRLQQVVSQAWSWSGDFPVPSDQLSGDSARFKRAVVIEHA
jgi:hypothetical protein